MKVLAPVGAFDANVIVRTGRRREVGIGQTLDDMLGMEGAGA